MEQDQESGLSLFLVFGVIVIGAIALFTRIRKGIRAKNQATNRPPSDDAPKPDT